MKMLVGLHKSRENQSTQHFAEVVAEFFEAEVTVTHPIVSREFLLEAQAGGYGLLAVPWAEKPRLDRVAKQVVTGADVSVLVVKDKPKALSRLLICSGGHPIAEPVIKTGARFAQAADAKVTLLHVSSAVPSMYTGLEAMEESIEELLQRDTPESQHLRQAAQIFQEHEVQAVIELRHGVAVDEIMRAAQRRDYDLIMVGASDAAPRLNRFFVGDVMQQIVDRAPCSIFVTRSVPSNEGA
jgi:nucleotide-binding universal stress UspA family protein